MVYFQMEYSDLCISTENIEVNELIKRLKVNSISHNYRSYSLLYEQTCTHTHPNSSFSHFHIQKLPTIVEELMYVTSSVTQGPFQLHKYK